MKFLFYQLEQLSAVCPPLTVKPFAAQSFTFNPPPPSSHPGQSAKEDQKSASVRLNFNCSQFIVASDTCPSSPIIYMVVTSFYLLFFCDIFCPPAKNHF